MTLEESFELIVIFFRLTNSPATFQTIINKILRNLINIREVASFIDNVIIRIEREVGYNEIVKEVVKRLAENNLYTKSIRFLFNCPVTVCTQMIFLFRKVQRPAASCT